MWVTPFVSSSLWLTRPDVYEGFGWTRVSIWVAAGGPTAVVELCAWLGVYVWCSGVSQRVVWYVCLFVVWASNQ